MGERVLIATARGLHEWSRSGAREVEAFAGCDVTALGAGDDGWWALADGRHVWRCGEDGAWGRVTELTGDVGTCLVGTPDGVLVGTEGAHLVRIGDVRGVRIPDDDAHRVRVSGGRAARETAFESVAGREQWYTPWGDPADVRSIARDRADRLWVNVHVGGVVRSVDSGRTWTPTLDIETDVHQVVVDPRRPGFVLVAAAVGLGVSVDGGDSWRFEMEGLHARYCRAVAVAGDTVLVSASTGPRTRRAALYRAPLPDARPLERCSEGLPAWFGANVDSGCVAACGDAAAFGTADGVVWISADAGRTWKVGAKGLPSVRAVAVDTF